jgi:hypothetical protein
MSELNLTLPAGWHELTEKQLDYFAILLLNKVPEPELLARCFMRFSGLCLVRQNPIIIQDALCYLYKKKKCGEHWINIGLFADMVSSLEWLLEDVKLFKNPVKIGALIGCNYKLFGISLEEYLIADQMYLSYAHTNNVEYLDRMIAVLYRRKSDRWNEGKKLSRWVRRFSQISLHRKYVVYLWFTGVKAWIIETYPYIFQSSGGESQSSTQLVMSILAALNLGDISKNPEIKRTEVHEALDMLNRKCEVIATH